ncbi:hypothetical protein HUX88_12900 [Duganella sp. BJB1802]|uniref:hypothetical protein n=1 Tax=Duganella sp. BJB1802 TaxID=2744575 RepID=UPI00159329F1|nr:hypothetical protein [Duganella sp. BJB1802]NVD71443.1 hypothetical protein [Duganella sp. BJB1802]
MSATLTSFQPAPMRRPGIVAGIAVSLVLHAALIFGYRLAAPTAPEPTQPAKAMTVWLRPAEPPKPIVAKVEPPPTPKPEPIQPRKRERPQLAKRANPATPEPAKAEAPAADGTGDHAAGAGRRARFAAPGLQPKNSISERGAENRPQGSQRQGSGARRPAGGAAG